MTKVSNPNCPNCKSSIVVKHGKTKVGSRRYRCKNCGKTFIMDKIDSVKPDLVDIAEAYLNGRTLRDLVSIFHSSPQRINNKIRDFLDDIPLWEDYLDSVVDKHEPKMVYLMGATFPCSCKGSDNNEMYIAVAMDALSSIVLGFELGSKEDYNVWLRLLDRLNCRGLLCPVFISTGQDFIEKAVKTVFPYAQHKISYYKTYKDKELDCCLRRLPINGKLINEAINSFYHIENEALKEYMGHPDEDDLRKILIQSSAHMTYRLRHRLDNRQKNRVEGFMNSLFSRIAKFHMVKADPGPILNGWIANSMLSRLDSSGFSRLSYYLQTPTSTSFKNFSCGTKPNPLKLNLDSPQMRNFIIELTVRGLQIPNQFFRCEMKMDNCSLI
jgi:predicted Zn finger-like uncharacterized protein